MLGILSPGRHLPIGLDIGADSIKMLQLIHSSGRLSVRTGARWRFPDSGAQDPARRKELAVGAIREMLHTRPFRGRKVVSCLSCADLHIKNVRLPRMSPEELSRAVEWEARERFSFEVGSDELNHLSAGEVRQGAESRDEVIMLATPRQAVQDHMDLLDQTGLVPVAIDAEPLALFRAFERFLRRRADDESVSVIVELGHSLTRVVVACGRRIVFIKSLETGGRRLIDAVAGQLNLTYAEAFDLRLRNMQGRRSPSSNAEGEDASSDLTSVEWTIHDAVRGEVEALAREIALCLRYCSVTFRGLRPKCVTLTGGEAYDRALVELLKANLGLPCEVGQPLKGMDTSGVDLGADRRGTTAEWAVCAGLAMRGVDLRTMAQEGEDAQRRLSA
jgi:type IV pilus assembly protein PilM